MLKYAQILKKSPASLEQAALAHLRTALAGIPFVTPGVSEQRSADSCADLTVELEARGQKWLLVCEFKRSGQPRYVREGAFQLRKYLEAYSSDRAYGVFIAPYLSEESTALLREESLGYFDFAGNCFLSFDGVFIERTGAPHTPERRRALRELFSPKASRVVRTLFTDPARHWRVTELASHAAVSLGQVSNVRRALLDREWASADPQGLRLVKPGALLDEWRTAYKSAFEQATHYYTLLHGEPLTEALKAAEAPGLQATESRVMLASFSAAQWISPFARTSGIICYASEAGEALLTEKLQLQPAGRGENVTVVRPKDDSVYIDPYEPLPGLHCTGALQTYLDLWASGDRGREAAEHLRQDRLDPQWSSL